MTITLNDAADADLTLIPDDAEVWIALKADVTNIAAMIPAAPDDDLAALGWSPAGLIDPKGIPVDPSGEIKEYDAFGRPNFRSKFKKGKLKTGFTVLEDNATTRKVVLPGSDADHIGIPKDTQIYVLYRFIDEDRLKVWVSLRPATVEITAHGGIVDGELQTAEIKVHHSPDANKDVFRKVVEPVAVTKVFTIAGGVTAYTVTVNAVTTSSITTLTAAALQSALRALASIGSSGVTVTGSSGGPLTAVFTVAAAGVSASGTGGTVTVS